MRSKTTKIIGAAAIVAALAGTGAAFTASNTLPPSVAGYGSSTISGATATSLNDTLAADGATITAAALVFTGDQTGRTIQANFGAAALTACVVGVMTGSATRRRSPAAATASRQPARLRSTWRSPRS